MSTPDGNTHQDGGYSVGFTGGWNGVSGSGPSWENWKKKVTHRSITDLIKFCQDNLDEQFLTGDPTGDALKKVVEDAAWFIDHRTEPNFAINMLYHVAEIWNKKPDYRDEWKCLD
jgi:hypothetical protein